MVFQRVLATGPKRIDILSWCLSKVKTSRSSTCTRQPFETSVKHQWFYLSIDAGRCFLCTKSICIRNRGVRQSTLERVGCARCYSLHHVSSKLMGEPVSNPCGGRVFGRLLIVDSGGNRIFAASIAVRTVLCALGIQLIVGRIQLVFRRPSLEGKRSDYKERGADCGSERGFVHTVHNGHTGISATLGTDSDRVGNSLPRRLERGYQSLRTGVAVDRKRRPRHDGGKPKSISIWPPTLTEG